jgi:iron complex outermembrane receptor protein
MTSRTLASTLLVLLLQSLLPGQNTGTVRGKVTIASTGDPLHRATVRVGRTGRSAETGEDGSYEITGLPPGTYTVQAHLHSLSDQTGTATIVAGQTATVDFALSISAVKQSVTVTATEQEQTTFESFQTVTSLDAIDLALQSKPSLGEVLENQPGVAKRSFGPGNGRPVIRGFDGDRVLVMQDGVPTGSLSSQSGDHGESLDSASLDRLEVIKGPATLLYGSNAIGGVVNAVTGHHLVHEHPHDGLRGYVTGSAGSANGQAGGAAGFDLGLGKWMLWGSGSGQRTGDYNSPLGIIENSGTRVTNSSGGFGRYGEKAFFDAGYRYEEGKYGVPALEDGGEDVQLAFRRHNARFTTGWRKAESFFEGFRLALNYSDWEHKELEGEEVGTLFRNKQTSYRGVFQQKRIGRLSGSFGFQGAFRDFKTVGEESLAPPVKQSTFAAFGLQEVSFEKFRLQFGGRVENNSYDPTGLRERSFTGFSGAAGIFIPVWKGGALVTNFTHSFRAPSLEELYNNGPHVGNATFELGNADLRSERSNGMDMAIRHQANRVRAEANFFYYDIRNFVYLAPTGEVEDGLPVADYSQANSRFTGTELGLDVGVHKNAWLNLGLDYVNAELRSNGEPLPRIPPLRGRVGLDLRFGGLSIRPGLRLANQQDRVFETETRTAGYGVFNLGASYTIATQHVAHVFGVDAFNLSDKLYRNHLSFIKERAPEIGRGVRFTYTLRFF